MAPNNISIYKEIKSINTAKMKTGDKMALEMLNASVVVLSEGNNPKLLNHDFLARNKIVPEDWNVRDVVITSFFEHRI